MDNQTVTSMAYYDGQTNWTIPLNNMKGSEVRISVLNEHLTVCEVQVIGKLQYITSSLDAELR